MIAPILITALLLIYFSAFIFGWSNIYAPLWVKVIGLIIPLFCMGTSIFVLIERIKEIRSDEEDDISKYWLHNRERIWDVGTS